MMRLAIQVLAAFTLWTALASAQDAAVAVLEDSDEHCLTLHEDFLRRQLNEWFSEGPFTIDDGAVHNPYISFNATTRQATIIVGNGNDVGGSFHPMVASDDPAMVHFITHIYVTDQDDEIFALSTMDPTQEGPATFVFDVPESVTQMTPWEFW
jgi:hypothetical protein